MKYLESIHIDGFRGLKDFKLDAFKDINILVGNNNTGKTTVLEAIHILEYPMEFGNYVSVLRDREGAGKVSPYNIFVNSINKDNVINKKVTIEGIINKMEINFNIEGEIVKLIKTDFESRKIEAFEGKLSYKSKETYGAKGKDTKSATKKIYIDEEIDKLKVSSYNSYSPIKIMRVLPFDYINKELESSVIKEGKKQEIINVLRLFDKNILGFELISEESGVKVYIQHKKTGMLPISSYGDGLKKVIYLSSAIIKARNGILLIDEIETTIHYSALKEVFNWLIAAADKYGVQIFATTHSLEAVDALLKCTYEGKGSEYLQNSINIITLKKNENELITRQRTMDGLKAYTFREDFNVELR